MQICSVNIKKVTCCVRPSSSTTNFFLNSITGILLAVILGHNNILTMTENVKVILYFDRLEQKRIIHYNFVQHLHAATKYKVKNLTIQKKHCTLHISLNEPGLHIQDFTKIAFRASELLRTLQVTEQMSCVEKKRTIHDFLTVKSDQGTKVCSFKFC